MVFAFLCFFPPAVRKQSYSDIATGKPVVVLGAEVYVWPPNTCIAFTCILVNSLVISRLSR